ncbi:MAG: TiaS agmantine-binding domain-containing protein [Candidatus Thorarchaeota archaeon]|jgi:tRNA(Ile2)-agmatinylcytidine synthase
MSGELIMMSRELHLGMDDIDSPRGGCTTHFASLVVEMLTDWGANWIDYPNLIRLNPNIPYRTRGNGAVALRFKIGTERTAGILPALERMIQEYVETEYPNTNPGVVLIEGSIPPEIRKFSERALWRTISIAITKRALEKNSIKHIYNGNGRGLIGALSAIGNQLAHDHTYEYIAYRSPNSQGQPRGVHEDSVIEMNHIMGEQLFSNIDLRTNRTLIAPHGPDPVLYGIRGESPEGVISAASFVKSDSSIDRWMVFRSNQGTGAHLRNTVYVADLRPYMAVVVHGVMDRKPMILEGGHVLFGIGDCSGRIDCAAYEPTGEFRETIARLVKGDQALVHAAVRPASRTHGLTLNVEGIEIIKLVKRSKMLNPICPSCSKRLKSAGRNQGYKCVNCGFKDPDGTKTEIPLDSELQETVYLPPSRAQRHLTRPLERLNRKNDGMPGSLIDKWHLP